MYMCMKFVHNEFQVYSFDLMIYFILYSIGRTLPNCILHSRPCFYKEGGENFIEKHVIHCILYIDVNQYKYYAKLDSLKSTKE